jgi:hypothetical protein
MNRRRFKPGAHHVEPLPGVLAQQRLRHLAAGGVVRAKEQDVLFAHAGWAAFA